jgi:hypothetical protein
METPTTCFKSKIGLHVYNLQRYYDGPIGRDHGFHYVCIFCGKTKESINGDGVIFISRGSKEKDLEHYQKYYKE